MVKVKKIKKNKVGKQNEVDSVEQKQPEVAVDKKDVSGSHRKQLEEIAQKDPDFFKFLQQEDADLLEFSDSDVDMETDEIEDEEEEEDALESIIIGKKVVNFDVDEDDRKIVNQQAAELIEKVLTDPSNHRKELKSIVALAVKAFHACVCRVGANLEKGEFVVNEDRVFDSIIRNCLKQMGHCFLLLMNPLDEKQKETKKMKVRKGVPVFKHFHKYKTLTRKYLTAVVELLSEVGNDEIAVAVIRSIIPLVDFFVHFQKTCRHLIKKLVRVWSQKSMEQRVAAFLIFNRISQVDVDLYTFVYKSCYVAYVSISRQITTGAWQNLLFMQKSFAELTFVNPSVSYQYVFVYIRQYAIHLRNAKITKRKDVIKTVYNWQFVLGIYLWAAVMIRSSKHRHVSEAVDWIRELRYPLIQIAIGLINVFPTARYIPLRLHCVRVLLQLQVNCGLYIPTLAITADLLDDLLTIDSKKPSNVKVLQKTTKLKDMIRLNREMLEDSTYRSIIADDVFEVFLEAAYVLRSNLAFSDVITPIVPVIKDFIKNCNNIDHKKLFKALESKLKEHAEQLRLTLAAHKIDLNDVNEIYKLEQILTADSTPVAKYHHDWHKASALRQKVLDKAEKSVTKTPFKKMKRESK
ncbi:unnamed protein product [Bursaphelenchus okinawaensis]|uniref:Nucleolar complex protein 2 homolog n=1 Tax=Bursaphelenchus okinawaensis TaxID=465554 RepID=A0A811K8A5_9BILA|nr:unnamed protein product [Bursaphelenchus okinawaensis]CAG9093760.1 unnamed protein product [Bursaphelenchus okinawaensis]